MRSRVYALAAGLALLAAAGRGGPAPADLECGTGRVGSRDLLALHEYWAQAAGMRAASSAAGDFDLNGVAVLEDAGDLVARRNPFDLDGARRIEGKREARDLVTGSGPG